MIQSNRTQNREDLSVIPTEDGSRTLYCAGFGQSYRSTHGALTEARHVFLDGAMLPRMLAAKPQMRILEIGFGTGLNFLLSAAASQSADTMLCYTGLDIAVPGLKQLLLLGYGDIASLRQVHAALVRWHRALPDAIPRGEYSVLLLPHCRLTLNIGDATTQALPASHFDVVYLDGFSPKVNPELWTPEFLQALFDATAPGGVLATYSCAGKVRRGLLRAGYTVQRRPGPPGKREVLAAEKPAH